VIFVTEILSNFQPSLVDDSILAFVDQTLNLQI